MAWKRAVALMVVVFALFAVGAAGQSDDQAWQADLQKWRAERAAVLQKPENWLSLIGLEWLKPGDNNFGEIGRASCRERV